MIQFIESFVEVLELLEKNEIQYMVVGSLAAMIYGDPRLTRDMDLVVEVKSAEANKFESLFPLDRYYCPPLEVLKSEIIHRGQFNLIHHGSGLKIDIMLKKNTEHSEAEFQRRTKMEFWKGFEAFVASAEDVIIKKLEFYRMGGSEKHLTDIRGIVVETPLDNNYLDYWIAKLGLQSEWKKTQ